MAPTASPPTPPIAAPDVTGQVVGILGGTGPQGWGWRTGSPARDKQVIIGSRSAERAGKAAEELGLLQGLSNAETARAGDIVIVAVPWEGHGAVLEELRDDLAGELVIDSVNLWASTRRAPTPFVPRRTARPSRPRPSCPTPGSPRPSTTCRPYR
ncbi:NAD(P)-binding domain-containing protein [Streptomyces capoamus]|uniref:NAD(P)-binding domain-containing protein n=1 Tax=Streptomyces capoamus TaxID=68183 RepID=UPI003C2D2D6C